MGRWWCLVKLASRQCTYHHFKGPELPSLGNTFLPGAVRLFTWNSGRSSRDYKPLPLTPALGGHFKKSPCFWDGTKCASCHKAPITTAWGYDI